MCGVPPLLFKYFRISCSVPTLVLTSEQMFQIGLVSPHLILKQLISLDVSLAQLVFPSVALSAELVCIYGNKHCLSFNVVLGVPVSRHSGGLLATTFVVTELYCHNANSTSTQLNHKSN